MEFSNGGFGGFGNFHNNEDGQEFKGFSKEDLKEKFKNQKKNFTKGKKILLGIVIALVILIALFGTILDFVMEIWQIQEIGSGYDTVFWKSLLTRIIVASSGFIVAFILTLINLFLVYQFLY